MRRTLRDRLSERMKVLGYTIRPDQFRPARGAWRTDKRLDVAAWEASGLDPLGVERYFYSFDTMTACARWGVGDVGGGEVGSLTPPGGADAGWKARPDLECGHCSSSGIETRERDRDTGDPDRYVCHQCGVTGHMPEDGKERLFNTDWYIPVPVGTYDASRSRLPRLPPGR